MMVSIFRHRAPLLILLIIAIFDSIITVVYGQYSSISIPNCPLGSDCVGQQLSSFAPPSSPASIDCTTNADGSVPSIGRVASDFAGFNCGGPGAGMKLCVGGSYCPDTIQVAVCPAGSWCHQGSSAPIVCDAFGCSAGSSKQRYYPLLILLILLILACAAVYLFMHDRLRKREREERSGMNVIVDDADDDVAIVGATHDMKNKTINGTTIQAQVIHVRESGADQSTDLPAITRRDNGVDGNMTNGDNDDDDDDDIRSQSHTMQLDVDNVTVRVKDTNANGNINIGINTNTTPSAMMMTQIPNNTVAPHIAQSGGTDVAIVAYSPILNINTELSPSPSSPSPSPSSSPTLPSFSPLLSSDPSSSNIAFDDDGMKTLLHSITGRICSGRLMAVMGPSGSGKTTFLNTLLGNVPMSVGSIMLNRSQSVSDLIRHNAVGYVPQHDIMLPMLTVSDVITHSAKMRLPQGLTSDEIDRRVRKVMKLVGITEIANRVIGDETQRGISGGQKKRVNIAIEVVAEPRMLLLDEPTSGLDSSSALQVCSSLSATARSGRLVICVIHQPRWEIFREFDDVLLLGKGGWPVYFGARNRVAEYFAQLGYEKPAGSNINPADYYMDVISEKSFLHKWKQSKLAMRSGGQPTRGVRGSIATAAVQTQVTAAIADALTSIGDDGDRINGAVVAITQNAIDDVIEDDQGPTLVSLPLPSARAGVSTPSFGSPLSLASVAPLPLPPLALASDNALPVRSSTLSRVDDAAPPVRQSTLSGSDTARSARSPKSKRIMTIARQQPTPRVQSPDRGDACARGVEEDEEEEELKAKQKEVEMQSFMFSPLHPATADATPLPSSRVSNPLLAASSHHLSVPTSSSSSLFSVPVQESASNGASSSGQHTMVVASDTDSGLHSYRPPALELSSSSSTLSSSLSAASLFSQFRYHVYRNALIDMRDCSLVVIDTVIQLLPPIALTINILNTDTYSAPLPLPVAQSCVSMIANRCMESTLRPSFLSQPSFFYTMIIGVASMMRSVQVFGGTGGRKFMSIYFRERLSGQSDVSYFLAKCVYDMLHILRTTLIFTCLFYLMSSPRGGLASWSLLVFLLYWSSSGLGYCVSILVSGARATTVGVVLAVCASVTSGLVPPLNVVANWGPLQIFWYLSYNRWGAEAITILNALDQSPSNGRMAYAIKAAGYDATNLQLDYVMMFVIGILWRIVTFVALKRSKPRETL